MTLEELDALPEAEARAAFLRCCGSTRWAAEMAATRPFRTRERLVATADEVWRGLPPEDWQEAFRAHPRIGSTRDVAHAAPSTRAWAESEQAGAATATDEVRAALAEANRAYEDRFGFIYLVCATGKTAPEMLEGCRARLDNDPETELGVAAEEQRKITRLRLDKLLGGPA